MKKIISILFLLLFLGLTFFSCQKNQETQVINNSDTVFLKDTIYLHDTIQQLDTLFIYDSIIFTDTIVMIDTIVIQDTSEFAYLFKHYELDSYEVLFYTIDKQKNPCQICRMNSNSHNIDVIKYGNGIYPIWAQDPTSVIYVDLSNYSITKEVIFTGEKSIIWNMDRNIMFIWYSAVLDRYLATYPNGNSNRVVAIDYHTGDVQELTNSGFNETHPSTSDVDDWIYFSREDEMSWNIYRRKLDNNIEEEVYIDNDFNMTSFKVSSDGKFLVTPKFKNEKGFVVFYDIERQRIIHELELPVDGYPMYATLSKDNKALFFVNGIRYDYTKPRNIYRMALDKTQLFQLTNFDEYLAIRPIVF